MKSANKVKMRTSIIVLFFIIVAADGAEKVV